MHTYIHTYIHTYYIVLLHYIEVYYTKLRQVERHRGLGGVPQPDTAPLQQGPRLGLLASV